jgi:glycosyltransferase involved in cell wall biosynthesis
MSIKVLVITNNHTIPVIRSEAEIFIGLKVQYGFDVTIMTFAHTQYIPRFEQMGIKVIKFHPHKKFSLGHIKRIRQELKMGHYDIVHMFNNKAMINGLFAAMFLPVKTVIYRGTIGNVHWWDPFAYLKHLSPRVDRIVCNVDEIKTSIQKNLLFNKSKVVTIAKGHKVEWYDDVEAVDLKAYGVPDNAFKVICVANVRKVKGIKYLLQATHYLKESSNIYLILVGNGMDKPDLMEIVEKSPIKANIKILGFQDNPLSFVKACDSFMLPSIYGESLTRSVIEAMCLEVAPVITNLPGNSRLVIHEKTGLTMPIKDPESIAKALERLSNDRSFAKMLGKNARIHIKNNIRNEDSVEAYHKLYTEMVKQ